MTYYSIWESFLHGAFAAFLLFSFTFVILLFFIVTVWSVYTIGVKLIGKNGEKK